MIKKLWVKFDGMDVECICDTHHRKCITKADDKQPTCKEYVVKFVEVDRTEEEATRKAKDFGDAVKLFEKKVKADIKKIQRFKLK